MHPDGYFALLLAPESSALLLASYATLADPLAHHCTVVHGTRDLSMLPPPFTHTDLGASFHLKVRGVATSERVQAVAVALVLPDGRLIHEGFSRNPIAHVTVATDGATEPFEANALLAAGMVEVDGPLLEARLFHSDAWARKDDIVRP